MNKRIGKRTIQFVNRPSINGYYTVVGKKEGEGPLRMWFDHITQDAHFGEKSWEKAESKMILTATDGALNVAGLTSEGIDFFVGGDLLNQCISTNYALRQLGAPYLGIYGACSTMAESLIIGASLIDGEFAQNIICAAGSHFCSAERQYRFPLEYGGQRPISSQWTVTGAGVTVLSSMGEGPYVTYGTVGKVIDYGVKDVNNMGAAMAPAACDSILAFFADTGFSPDDYDMILTGDLGEVGLDILKKLLSDNNLNLNGRLNDCGCMIFNNEEQETHSGGSGCGCSASVLNSFVIKKMKDKLIKKILLCATGALMSPTSSQQGESIPGIAHVAQIEI